MKTLKITLIATAFALAFSNGTLAQNLSKAEFDDTVITTKAKAAVLGESSLKSPEINVETDKGIGIITRTTLPDTYKPYQKLTVCSNVLIGGGHLVVLGDVLPLLVGSGEGPTIWLQIPNDKSGRSYVPLVTASVASHPAVVVSNKDGLTVSIGGVPVIHVRQVDQDSAVIDLLDLRPVGLNIYGNASSLTAGDTTFSQNTFSGVSTLLAFGGGH
jgi:hypothetical protein